MSGYSIPRKKSDPEGKKSRKNPRDIPKVKNPEKIPGILRFSGCFTRDLEIFGMFHSGFSRDFFRIFKSQSRSLGLRDFRDFALGIFSGSLRGFKIPIPIPGIFGIFFSQFFRDFQIPIPIPGISGFFDPALNKKSRSREKIPSRSQL